MEADKVRTGTPRINLLLAAITIALLSSLLAAQTAQPPARHPAGPVFGPVVSEKGMVTSSHPLAAQAGLRILREGGNAFDAAAAVAVAVGVLESDETDGITGEGFGIFYIAKTGEVKVVDWGSRIPDNPEFLKHVQDTRQQDNPVNLIAPGALAGIDSVVKTLGKLTLAQVLQPSIEYCEQGIPVREDLRRAIEHRAEVLRKDPNAAAIFLPDGKVPPLGYPLKMLDEARSLRLIATQGKDVLYKGELAKEILAWSKEVGGLITPADMEFVSKPRWVQPLSTTYHGYTIYAVPPASGGIPLLQAMNILEGFNLKGMSEAERTHIFAETFKISLNEMETYFGDPDRTNSRLQELLSKDYAAKLRAEIQPDKVLPWKLVSHDEPTEHGTTTFAVVDAEGNVASITNTRSSWGIARPAGHTGLFLHAGTRLLSANPNHPMYVRPGKRLQKSIAPYLVLDSQKRVVMAAGASGGRTITHTNAQVLVNVLDLGMNIEQAIAAPRVSYSGAGQKLEVGYGFFPDTVESLRKLGYDIRRAEVGGAQGITIDPVTKGRMGGADPRRDGGVAAY